MRISDWSSDVCSSDLLVGIGGGIFLAPLLHLTRWRDARAIAATASLFILINSMFGLAGQMLKNGPEVVGQAIGGRSEERRVGKECGRQVRYSGVAYL